MVHSTNEQSRHRTAPRALRVDAGVQDRSQGTRSTKPCTQPAQRPLIDRIFRGFFVGLCVGFGLVFGVFAYALIFDMRELLEATSLLLTQLGLVLMANLAALLVRDHL